MFPEEFVRRTIEVYTVPGEVVFDPFSGRGTTVLQALLMGRNAAAVDINPVAYCISSAKAECPPLPAVLNEIDLLETSYNKADQQVLENQRRGLSSFFRRAFYHSTLRELLFLRMGLNWKEDSMARFIAALVLGSLHGEMGKPLKYFSNQMPRTISTKPGYSLRYWRMNNLWPQKRNVFRILRERAEYRLSGELPTQRGDVAMVDARHTAEVFPHLNRKVQAVVTSPPYYNVTNYEEDQWLRLWFLGSKPHPTYRSFSKDDRHKQKDRYWRFLREVWKGVAPLLKPRALLICRLGAKGMSKAEITQGLLESISAVFPRAFLLKSPIVSKIRNRQTEYFRPGSKGCVFEVDYVFRVS